MDGLTWLLTLAGALWTTLVAPHVPRHDRSFFMVEEADRLPEDPSTEGTSTTGLSLVDVDGDGDLDLFVSQGTAGLEGRPNRLLINDGTGRFADESAARLAATNNVANTTKTAFGDVDGDGDLDALLANLGPEHLLLNDGHGTFALAPPGQLPPSFGPDVTADVSLVDVDDDGDLDALLANENPFLPGPDQGAQNRLLRNDGRGSFLEAPLPAATDQSVAMLSGDLDDDGDLDIVVLNRGLDRVLMGDGEGGFVEETASRIPPVDPSIPNASSARGGALADLDGDDDLDLVVANSRGQAVEYYRNDGRGVLVAARFGHVPDSDETIAASAVDDLDGDGDLDVYLANAGRFEGGHGFLGGPDRYFENTGRGKFKERTARHFDPPADPSTAATFGDVDGDGDLDLLVGNSDPAEPGHSGAERIFIQRQRCGPWWK